MCWCEGGARTPAYTDADAGDGDRPHTSPGLHSIFSFVSGTKLPQLRLFFLSLLEPHRLLWFRTFFFFLPMLINLVFFLKTFITKILKIPHFSLSRNSKSIQPQTRNCSYSNTCLKCLHIGSSYPRNGFPSHSVLLVFWLLLGSKVSCSTIKEEGCTKPAPLVRQKSNFQIILG